MPKKTKQILILGVIVYLIILTFPLMAGIKESLVPGIKFHTDNAVYMYFYAQPFGANGSFIIMTVLPFVVISILSSFYIIFMKNTNGITNIIQRLGYNKFLKNSVLQVFSISSLISLIISIYEIIIINWTYFPFAFSNNGLFLSQRAHFSTNSLINLISYIITSSIGWGIFSVLIFGIGLFIKKDSIFLISSLVVAFSIILICALIPINNITIFISNLIIPMNLLAPGQVSFASQPNPPLGLTWTWIINAIIYSLIAFALIKLWHKKQLRGA
ncbi:hypothetical protein J2Z60_000546 [Lactobacillus colini]|uniref:ABC transporter permease n=1 Tax=Lactobacillus colini TaxID=1819254 RepID=A0ABS4MCH0_9LACO|nr:hypothetical protein [Lactobacillus colini]MBP2057382.1 hypothetical protein [Lactobacillus colini]